MTIKKYTFNQSKREYILVPAKGYPKLDPLVPEGGRERLHCEDGPAMLMVPEDWNGTDVLELVDEGDPSGCALYVWHGIIIAPHEARIIIEHPEELTVEFINKLTNVEVRRIAMERFGYDRYARESKAKVLHEDLDKFGKKRQLIKIKVPDDDPIVGVLVYNSTPNGTFDKVTTKLRKLSDFAEHDKQRILRKYDNTGHIKNIAGELYIEQHIEEGKFNAELDKNGNLVYKQYFMRVHPELRPMYINEERDEEGDPVVHLLEPQAMTCHNAIASLVGLYGDEYDPDVES